MLALSVALAAKYLLLYLLDCLLHERRVVLTSSTTWLRSRESRTPPGRGSAQQDPVQARPRSSKLSLVACIERPYAGSTLSWPELGLDNGLEFCHSAIGFALAGRVLTSTDEPLQCK